ncbi:MAG: rhomboid family intramembrane serine protease [Planctomycetota bacterium]
MLFPLFDRNPTRRVPWLTLLLIVVNVGVHAWASGLSQREQLDLVYERGLVPKRMTEVGSGKPLDIQQNVGNQVFKTRLETGRGSVYAAMVTMMFLHGSWLHLLPNMWMLWIFGNNIEDRLGRLVFAGFYLTGGILACYSQWLIDPQGMTPVIGASGAVWALLGGYAVTYPKAKVYCLLFIGIPLLLNLPALVVIGVYFVVDLVNGLVQLQNAVAAPIAYWAHLGGCVAGAMLMPILSIGAPPADADWRSEEDALRDPAAPINRSSD